jgi:hypothetical protein
VTIPYVTQTEAKRMKIPRNGIQTILIPRSKYSLEKARDWLHDHGYHYGSHRTTPHFYRFWQENPVINAEYYTKRITNGIEFVFQKY